MARAQPIRSASRGPRCLGLQQQRNPFAVQAQQHTLNTWGGAFFLGWGQKAVAIRSGASIGHFFLILVSSCLSTRLELCPVFSTPHQALPYLQQSASGFGLSSAERIRHCRIFQQTTSGFALSSADRVRLCQPARDASLWCRAFFEGHARKFHPVLGELRHIRCGSAPCNSDSDSAES
eukprot:365620-Chlamydomonas_euryale.AAC.2